MPIRWGGGGEGMPNLSDDPLEKTPEVPLAMAIVAGTGRCDGVSSSSTLGFAKAGEIEVARSLLNDMPRNNPLPPCKSSPPFLGFPNLYIFFHFFCFLAPLPHLLYPRIS
jgi:pentatricopeptide repeat protein